jgi:cytochrome d ubiquinol oxidase subunit I
VGITGIASGILVVSANSRMNDPSGFDFVQNKFIHIDPYRAMFNEAWFEEALHMSIAAFAATGFAVAGVHAYMILKRKNVEFHSSGFRIAATFGCIAALLQPFSGDLSARFVATHQPAKLAAMEAHFKTGKRAPLIIGGIPDVKNKTVKYDLEVPALLSVMVHGDPDAEVTGLDKIPVEQQPPVLVVHYAFQSMVAFGMAMLAVSLVYFIALFWRRGWFYSDWLFKLFALLTPVGFIAVESGWTVTEVGRQPWIIQGFMTTAKALTPMPGIRYTFYLFTLVYISLAFTVIFLLYRQIRMVPVKYDHYN